MSSGGSAVEAEGPLVDLAWLAGHWISVDAERTVEEQWLGPRAEVMLGVSRSVVGPRFGHSEFLRIEARPGAIVYVANPSSQAPAEFTRVDDAPRRATFENLEHDYPQRIIYSRDGDRLEARIEDAESTQINAWSFTLVR